MKKVLIVCVCTCLVCIGVLNIFASAKADSDKMPAFLEPLRVEFSNECKNAKWKYGAGITEPETLMPRLENIIKRRDALLKQHGVKYFKVEWTVEDFRTDGESVKPHAHFSGWYLD